MYGTRAFASSALANNVLIYVLTQNIALSPSRIRHGAINYRYFSNLRTSQYPVNRIENCGFRSTWNHAVYSVKSFGLQVSACLVSCRQWWVGRWLGGCWVVVLGWQVSSGCGGWVLVLVLVVVVVVVHE